MGSKNDGITKMERAKNLAKQAEKMAMDAIVEGARHVLRSGPLASEYVQAMGSWTFTVIIPFNDGSFYEEMIGRDDDEIKRLVSYSEEFKPEYVPLIEPFIEKLKDFRELVDTYHDLFDNTPAGTPMRFKATGPIITEW
jgi:hypothetical protein